MILFWINSHHYFLSVSTATVYRDAVSLS